MAVLAKNMVAGIALITFFITKAAYLLADVASPSHPLCALQAILMELSVLKLRKLIGLQDRKDLLLDDLVLSFPQFWTLASTCGAAAAILPTDLAKRVFEADLSAAIGFPALLALKDDRLP